MRQKSVKMCVWDGIKGMEIKGVPARNPVPSVRNGNMLPAEVASIASSVASRRKSSFSLSSEP
jgi:hypothetical protein